MVPNKQRESAVRVAAFQQSNLEGLLLPCSVMGVVGLLKASEQAQTVRQMGPLACETAGQANAEGGPQG